MNGQPFDTTIDAERVWFTLSISHRDMTEEKIRRMLGMSGNRFKLARKKLLKEKRIATVNGKPVTYTVLRKE